METGTYTNTTSGNNYPTSNTYKENQNIKVHTIHTVHKNSIKRLSIGSLKKRVEREVDNSLTHNSILTVSVHHI